MSYFSTVCYLSGYHLILVLFTLIGVLRFPRSKPQRWFVAGFLIQLMANCRYTGEVPAFFLFLYLIILSLLLQGIIRLQASVCRR